MCSAEVDDGLLLIRLVFYAEKDAFEESGVHERRLESIQIVCRPFTICFNICDEIDGCEIFVGLCDSFLKSVSDGFDLVVHNSELGAWTSDLPKIGVHQDYRRGYRWPQRVRVHEFAAQVAVDRQIQK